MAGSDAPPRPRLRPLDLVEMMADRIAVGPQATPEVFEAMRQLRRQGAQSETLKEIWELMGRDVAKDGGAACIGVDQMLNAGLNRLAREVRMQRLDPVQLHAAKVARGLA